MPKAARARRLLRARCPRAHPRARSQRRDTSTSCVLPLSACPRHATTPPAAPESTADGDRGRRARQVAERRLTEGGFLLGLRLLLGLLRLLLGLDVEVRQGP